MNFRSIAPISKLVYYISSIQNKLWRGNLSPFKDLGLWLLIITGLFGLWVLLDAMSFILCQRTRNLEKLKSPTKDFYKFRRRMIVYTLFFLIALGTSLNLIVHQGFSTIYLLLASKWSATLLFFGILGILITDEAAKNMPKQDSS